MPVQNIDQAMQLAVSHQQAGRLAEAEPIYRQVLAAVPNHADALHLLGVLHGQTGRHDVAAALICKAISASPRNPAFYSNLALSQLQLSQFDAAANTYQQLIALQPGNADAHYQLGNILFMKGIFNPAIASYQRAIAANPQHFQALHNLGNALFSAGQNDQAVLVCTRAIALNSLFPATHNNLGNAYKARGDFPQAIACYQHALRLDPNYADAHNNLGNTRRETEEYDLAVASYQQAIALNPGNAEYHANLGSAYLAKHEWDTAVESLQRALSLNPNDAIAFYNLGLIWKAKEDPQQSADSFEKALALRADYFDALLQLGLLELDNHQHEKAIEHLNRALVIKPRSAEAHNAMGLYWHGQGRFAESISSHLRALEIKPDYLQAHHNLGNSLLENGTLPAAINSYERALALDPRHTKVLGALANAWKLSGQLDQAKKYFEQALAIDPGEVANRIAIAGVYQDMGEIDIALDHFHRALEIKPDSMPARDGLLFALGFQLNAGAELFFKHWSEWNRQFVQPLAHLQRPHTNDRAANRRLRIGYVSPDFKMHPISRFMIPLLAAHDHERFEIFCYANLSKPDATTAEIQALADHWIVIHDQPDEQVADRIRTDQIDILIDLSMHTDKHRLMVFARKPAPVQITYLALASGTGVGTIDYRFTDNYLDPDPADDRFYLEESIRLRGSYWCYQPNPKSPAIVPLPATAHGYITLGCLNRFSKISSTALKLWAGLLQSLANSRLILHLNYGTHRDQLLRFMSDLGITADRIECVPFLDVEAYLATYQRIDIALDPFPCNGATTTCDALWMGVPVVTLAGATSLARASASILANAGFPQWVAHSTDEYKSLVLDLASNREALSQLRLNMRKHLQKSPLMDAGTYTRSIESAYCTLWKRWCDQSPASS